MTTPLIIIVILIAPAVLGASVGWLTGHPRLARIGAVTGLAGAYAFFAIGHFALTEDLALMLPPFVPGRRAIVLITGVLEVLIALGLLIPRTRRTAGIVSIVVLLLFFPANVYSAFAGVGYGAKEWGPWYLAVRAPLQALLIFWSYQFAVRRQHIG